MEHFIAGLFLVEDIENRLHPDENRIATALGASRGLQPGSRQSALAARGGRTVVTQ